MQWNQWQHSGRSKPSRGHCFASRGVGVVLLAFVAAGLGRPVAARVEEGVVLRAEAPHSAPGKWVPFTAGLPLPPGWLRNATGVTITERGRSLPMQVAARALWPDGSIRWLGVEWVAAPVPAGSREFRFQKHVAAEGEQQPDVPLVKVRRDGEDLWIDNGALQLRIPRRSAAWFELAGPQRRLWDRPDVSSEAMINGTLRTAGPPDQVQVVEPGPLRVRVERRGSYGGGDLRYVVRLDFFAGLPVVRVFHTLEVHADLPGIRLDRLTVRLPSQRGKRRALRAWRVGSTPLELAVGQGPLWLAQVDAEHILCGHERTPGRLSGQFSLAAEKSVFGLTMRDFWQQFPQAVGWSGQRWEYDLYARQGPPVLAGTGAAKTHEFLLTFDLARDPKSSPVSVDAFSSAAPHARWVASTGALRNAVDPSGPLASEFLHRLRDAYERVQRAAEREEWDDRGVPDCPNPQGKRDPLEHRRRGFYGMWNWGDWNFPGYHDNTKGCDAWGNLEYDLPQVLALAYAATGADPFLHGLIASARHFMDVDVIHAQPRYPQWVGMNHPKNPLHWSFDKGGVDLGHTWTEGLLSYYLITGDERGLTAAKGIGEFLLRRLRAPLKGNPRQFGWPQIALVALYETTGDARYLEGAHEYARQGMARHQPTGVQNWKLGILAEGLAYLHSVRQDGAVWRWLEEYAAAVHEKGRSSDVRLWPAVAYVASVKSQPEMVEAAEAVVRSLQFGNWAKPFTIAGRVGFSIIYWLQRAGAKAPSAPGAETPVPPSPGS